MGALSNEEDDKDMDTYDDLDLARAMDLPVDVERPAPFSSHRQLSAFGRCKLEDGVWICRMGDNLGHGWVSRPGLHVRCWLSCPQNGFLCYLHLELWIWRVGDAASDKQHICRQSIYFGKNGRSTPETSANMVFACHVRLT
jgi:hypothetical protein